MMCKPTGDSGKDNRGIENTQESTGELNSKIYGHSCVHMEAESSDEFSAGANPHQPTKAIRIRQQSYPKKTRLSSSFTPGPYDVICARGKEAHNHIGNYNFRRKVEEHSNDYARAESKMFKSLVVSAVVDWVRAHSSPEGGFVKQINGVWYEVGDQIAREKTGQALRESNHLQYKSSTKAKRRRWKKERNPVVMATNDELGELALADKVIAKALSSADQQRNKMGGDEANDERVLELFNHTNKLILNRICTDSKIQERTRAMSETHGQVGKK